MRVRLRSAFITRMAVAPRKRLILELDPDAEPIVGCLRDDQGQRFEFTGWLGFSSALGQALSPPPEAPSTSDGGPQGRR